MISSWDLLPCLPTPVPALELSMACGKAWCSVAGRGVAWRSVAWRIKAPSPQLMTHPQNFRSKDKKRHQRHLRHLRHFADTTIAVLRLWIGPPATRFGAAYRGSLLPWRSSSNAVCRSIKSAASCCRQELTKPGPLCQIKSCFQLLLGGPKAPKNSCLGYLDDGATKSTSHLRKKRTTLIHLAWKSESNCRERALGDLTNVTKTSFDGQKIKTMAVWRYHSKRHTWGFNSL